jgi:Fur family iron response transcriptional regulator
MQDTELEALMERHGVMPTRQRVEVAGVLLAKPQHLSAEQLIDHLRSQGSRVSKATVYNTLNLFSERGLVREITVDSTRKFYDSTTRSHHHFYNMDTGRLSDVPESQVIFLNLPELPEGTEQHSVEVLIRLRDKTD